MRILYHHRTRSKDGQFVHIEEMIGALRANGHEVIIVAPPSAETESFGSDAGGVALLKRYLPKWFYEIMELGYSLVAYRRLAAAVKLHKPDCLYERYNLFLPAGIWLARKYKLPMLLEINAPILEERSRYDGLSMTRLARWSQAYAWRNADMVLPVTRVLGDIVAGYGVAADKIVVIPNGINAARFDGNTDVADAKRALGLDGHLVLGFTGFVRDWHGLDKVIDMIATDPPEARRYLLVVGDGPVRADARAAGARAGRRAARQIYRHHRARRRRPLCRRVRHRAAAGRGGVRVAAQAVRIPRAGQGDRRPGPAEHRGNPHRRRQRRAVRPGQPRRPGAGAWRACRPTTPCARAWRPARAPPIGLQKLTWNENALRVINLFEGLQRHA